MLSSQSDTTTLRAGAIRAAALCYLVSASACPLTAGVDGGVPDGTLLPVRDAAAPSDAGRDSGADVSRDAAALEVPPDAATPRPDAKAERDGGTSAELGDTCSGTPYAAYVSDPRLCVRVYASDLSSPRQMAFAENGDLFVNDGDVTVLWDDDRDGESGSGERGTFASASGLNHGLAFDRSQRFVYAASTTTIYRWPYTSGLRRSEQPAEVVVKNIPSGGHASRTLVFDAQDRLYVSIGSASNLDASEELWTTRALIRRFELSDNPPPGGFEFSAGSVVASGLRNEVGLFVDADDRLWGVDNERDSLQHDALGGDIHNDNPAEEINLIDGQGTNFYGYPFCYTEFRLSAGDGTGTQWADVTLPSSVRKSDAWCRDPVNARAPAFAMQAHYAPLGITQYTGRALPFEGDFIITSHGSWNRSPAVGRLLLRAHAQNGPITSVEPIVGERDDSGGLREGSWDARPVDVQQGPDQALYFSDDQGGRVFKVGYE